MNTLDIILLIFLLIGGLNGLRKGFISAFANLVGWLCALVLGAKYANTLAPSMSILSHDPVVQKIAAFAFIVLIVVILTWIVTAILNSLLKSMKLGPINRLVGGMFGTIKGLLIVLITIQGLQPWVESSPHWKQSKVIHTLLPYAPLATELSKEAVNEVKKQINAKPEKNHSYSNETVETDVKSIQSQNSTQNPFN